jgi:predicted O-linked N-acetylglucosamine transferase (SPINDLY family)
MLFADDTTAADLQAEEARWASRHVLPLLAKAALHERGREPERRLRIGYVSPDFREHPVARYLLPVFEAHDREAVEVVLYYTGSRRDAFTDRCRAAAGLWRECAGVSDEAFAQRIREDGIDLLVDLSLHMAENRMLTFARKPAPVQISFSYPARTGSPAIDWRMSDEHLDPPGEDAAGTKAAGVAGPSPATRQGARRYAPEQVARIAAPHCFWCFDPHEEHGEAGVRPLPLLTSGYVTFGSLNNAAKTTPTAIAHWSGVLRAVPRSRMVLLSGGGGAGGGAPTDSAIAAEFARRGIDPARVQFLPRGSRAAYLRHYGRIDIGIDPYPYTGHTTSCDAFWSGVPVLTLAGTGALPVARGGVSLLRTLGLPELIAESPDALAEIAVALAGDVPRLRGLSETMCERMRSSPLMDAPGYTREVERLYRAAWRQWCERGE